MVGGDAVFRTEAPFPVTLVPHWLTASWPWLRHIDGE